MVETSRSPIWRLLPALALFAVYVPSLSAGPITDDLPLLLENPFLIQADGLWKLLTSDLWAASGLRQPTQYFRPLPMLSFWLQFRLGSSVEWLRLGNVFTAALTALLLVRLLRHCLPKGSTWTALAIATLWGLHPINTEPVVWLSGRFDLFVALFVIAALTFNFERTRRWSVPGFFAAALLSKEIAVCLLPLLLFQDVRLKRSLPVEGPKYFLLILALSAYFSVRSWLDIASASEALATLTPGSLVQSYATLVMIYGQLLLWPFGFDAYHWYAPTSPLMAGLVLSLALLASFRALRGLRSSKVSIGVLLGIPLALGTLLPPALIGPNQWVYGDRFAYLPWCGLCIAAVTPLSRMLQQSKRIPRLLCVALLGLAAFWSTVTILRSREWRSEEALGSAALDRFPHHPHWTMLTSHKLLDKGAAQEARDLLLPVTQNFPRYSKVHNALCVAELRLDNLEAARSACSIAVKLAPDRSSSWMNLASVLVAQQKWQEASRAARRALASRSHYAEAEYILAISEANLGNLKEARHWLHVGLRSDPQHQSLLLLKEQMGVRGLLEIKEVKQRDPPKSSQ